MKKTITLNKEIKVKEEVEIELPSYYQDGTYTFYSINEDGIVQVSDNIVFITKNGAMFYDSEILKIINYEKCEQTDFYKKILDLTANLNNIIKVSPTELIKDEPVNNY
jgi:hypothetical protein